MTIEDLYEKCDLINIYTKVFIIDSDRCIKTWGTTYENLTNNICRLLIDHFTMIGNNEVIVWVP